MHNMEYKEIIDNKRIKYYLPEYFTPAQEFTFLSNWHYKIFCVNGNTGFQFESRIFYFIHLQNEKDYERKKSSSA